VETVDLVSDSDGEEDDDGMETTSTTADQSNSGKIADRMKLPGGALPSGSSTKSHSASRTGTPTPPPAQSSSSAQSPTPDNPSRAYQFDCNKAMFGELKGQTLNATRCGDNRIYLSLQCMMMRDGTQIPEKYTLSVGHNDVQRILVHFGRVPSFVAIETSARFAEVACRRIGKEVLVPNAMDPKKRYIILGLESAFKLDAEATVEMNRLSHCLKPWANVSLLNLHEAQKLIKEAELDLEQNEKCYGNSKTAADGGHATAEELFTYQPGSKSGGIPVTTEDRACLAEGIYLNDIIIDFYLKYLYESVLTPAQQEKTYMFNSYFYKRLTQKQGTKFSPEQMHGLVAKWTRNIDLFDKDFVIIPVNEHCHWYLVVICFPGGAFVYDDDLSEREEEEEEEDAADFMKESKSDDEDDIVKSNGTDSGKLTIPLKSKESGDTEVNGTTKETDSTSDETSNKVTSNGESESSNGGPVGDGDSTSTTEATATSKEAVGEGEKSPPSTPVKEKIVYKQANEAEEFVRPCILIFDSLVGSGHSRVFTNLRHYLSTEWALRKPDKPARVFDKSNMKGCYPKIPRQNNDCDCGVFLLQYVESFFLKSIQSFRIPIHLESWFTQEYVSKKRSRIQELINELAQKFQDEKDEQTKTSSARE